MSTIREILEQLELHDSSVESVTIKGDGSVELVLDIDYVWNKELDLNVSGILFESVYELSEFKIDRLNVIGGIEVEDIEGYNKDFVLHVEHESNTVTMVSIEFVAGGRMDLICSGSARLLRGRARQAV